MEPLTQAVAEFLGPFSQVPLRMAAKPGVVVEHAQQDRVEPLAIGQQHAHRAVMKVQVPQPVDILAFITSNLTVLKTQFGFVERQGCEWDRGGDA